MVAVQLCADGSDILQKQKNKNKISFQVDFEMKKYISKNFTDVSYKNFIWDNEKYFLICYADMLFKNQTGSGFNRWQRLWRHADRAT